MHKTTFPPITETTLDCNWYQLEFVDDQGEQVHEVLATEEFSRAICETWFAGFRAGVLDSYSPQLSMARIEPRFLEGGDCVRSDGFRIRLPLAEGGDFSCDFSIDYFHSRASALRASLQLSEKLQPQRKLYFRLGAYLVDNSPSCDGELPSCVCEGVPAIEPPTFRIPIRKLRRDTFASADPWDSPNRTELPVLISRSLLEDSCDEASRNPAREVGGLLLGQLCQDPESREVFLLVTCLVSAEGTTQATATSVTFSPASFSRAREMIRLRENSNEPPEILVGWFHSHPFRVCNECPVPMPTECIQKVLFFSPDDIQLMESTFAQPFMVGLLAAVEPRLSESLCHLPARLFGWRQGQVLERGFHVVDA